MKNTKLLLVLATVMLTASCAKKQQPVPEVQKPKDPKILVLYYSQTSNTKAVAQEIAKKLNADIEEIIMTQPYDGDFQATIDRCMVEREQGIIPDIKPVAAKIADYDVIFLGYPVWFGTYAPPVATFLKQTNLNGKKIVPFCTFGSGGLESSVKDLEKAAPKATVLDGYGVRAARLDAMPYEVDQFLKAGGFLQGEYTRLEMFSAQREVSDKEEVIFNTAVDGYPMLHAKAKTFASRNIPNGVEYLFYAIDLPRKDNPKMPPAGELQVYVTVENGKAPVFTKVIR